MKCDYGWRGGSPAASVTNAGVGSGGGLGMARCSITPPEDKKKEHYD
jgi:hypothetical protein